MRKHFSIPALGLVALLASTPAATDDLEDAGAVVPTFQEGDLIGFDEVQKLKPFLPEEFWDNRDFFFYEGMQLEIGPTMADYTASKQYVAAT